MTLSTTPKFSIEIFEVKRADEQVALAISIKIDGKQVGLIHRVELTAQADTAFPKLKAVVCLHKETEEYADQVVQQLRALGHWAEVETRVVPGGP